MLKFEQILVVADPGNPQPALTRALALAAETRCRIDLVGFVYDAACDDDSELPGRERKRQREALVAQRLAELEAAVAAQKPRTRVSVRVVWAKHLSLWLCAEAAASGADLVLKSSHPSQRPFYTPSDWHLIRELSLPLWLVRPGRRSMGRGPVLATLDATRAGAKALALDRSVLDTARGLAALLGRATHAAYVHPLPRLKLDLEVVDKRRLMRAETDKAQAGLGKRIAKLAPRADEIIQHASVGPAAHGIAKLAGKLDAAVVVFGTAAKQGVKRLFLGSTVEESIVLVGADIVVVKGGR